MIRALLSLSVIAVLLAATACEKKRGPNTVVVQPAPGSLELLIVANDHDDEAAFTIAKEYFERARTDPKQKAELQRRAVAGEAPQAPHVEGLPFVVHGQECSYRWAPLSAALLNEMRVDPPPADPLDRSNLCRSLEQARPNGMPYVEEMRFPIDAKEFTRSSQMWWSRTRPGAPGNTDYFLLLRESPADEAISADEIALSWDPDASKDGVHHIEGQLTATGKKKFADLTTHNQPSRNGSPDLTKRFLAIVVRGKVVSSPMLNLPLTSGSFWISSGRGGAEYAEKLIAALRGE